ncbi:hypothetical protein Q4R69_20200 [Morganella morganii subsp. sibonii]
MKVRLLNDGGYNSLETVEFPVIVDGFYYDDVKHCIGVRGDELLSIGGDSSCIFSKDDLSFLLGEECEVVNEQIS